jgi:hypothetical protein
MKNKHKLIKMLRLKEHQVKDVFEARTGILESGTQPIKKNYR